MHSVENNPVWTVSISMHYRRRPFWVLGNGDWHLLCRKPFCFFFVFVYLFVFVFNLWSINVHWGKFILGASRLLSSSCFLLLRAHPLLCTWVCICSLMLGRLHGMFAVHRDWSPMPPRSCPAGTCCAWRGVPGTSCVFITLWPLLMPMVMGYLRITAAALWLQSWQEACSFVFKEEENLFCSSSPGDQATVPIIDGHK